MELFESKGSALGVVVDCERLCTAITGKRRCRLERALAYALQRGRLSGRDLECLLGHCTYAGLVRREVLSVFSASYAFVQANYWERQEMWASVREELCCFRGLLIFLSSDWVLPWNRCVTASDASESGFGVTSTMIDATEVARVGRVAERSRFRLDLELAPRQRAMQRAGFVDDEGAGPWRPSAPEEASAGAWALDENFDEVPAGWLDQARWSLCRSGVWSRAEGIAILEARAVLAAVRRLAQTRWGHDIRHVHLCDNMGVVLSICRSRSKDYSMLAVIRRINAYLLARNIRLIVRWIPSELNSADEASRIF